MDVAKEIPVRRMNFEFPDDMELVFIEGDPATSYYFVGAWMMLPYLEPFLIRTMQSALDKVDDPVLREEMKRFCAQEGQHFRQHARANEVVKRIHPAGLRLAELEKEVEALFARWSNEMPLKFNLAYAEGFEAMTCAGARTQIDVGMFDYMKEPIRGLMYWHIMEEIEHRSVCFDVYEKLVGDYLYRTRMSLWFQKHYLGLCQKFAAAMYEADPETVALYNTPQWAAIRKKRRAIYNRNFLPRYLGTFLPWYNPAKVDLPSGYHRARQTYTDLAVGVQ